MGASVNSSWDVLAAEAGEALVITAAGAPTDNVRTARLPIGTAPTGAHEHRATNIMHAIPRQSEAQGRLAQTKKSYFHIHTEELYTVPTYRVVIVAA